MKVIDLKGKVAVITGGAGQLGKTMVRELAKCGGDVVIGYFSQDQAAKALEEEIVQKYGVRSLAAYVDVTDYDSVTNMKKCVNDSLGAADIIINNSVVQYQWKSVLEQNFNDYDSQYKSCVMQSVYMAKAFIPDMIAKKYGRVIGINTECSMQMFPFQSAYVAGKRGMDGVYKVLAREVGQYNITVNQVAPGWIKSEKFQDADGTESNLGQNFPYIERVPMGRRGTDNEVADAVCFLASDLASFITGAYIPVCGGNVMPCI